MNDVELGKLVKRLGATGKLVRAICASHSWHWTTHGAPPEWYAACHGSLGMCLETILRHPLNTP